jgi:hypothetical protein
MSDMSLVDRRLAGRQSIERRVKLLVESDRTNTHRDAVTLDLCPLGARVQSDVPLSPGQSIDLIFKQDVPVILSAQVVWVDVAPPTGLRQAGLKFTDPANIPRALLTPGSIQDELA